MVAFLLQWNWWYWQSAVDLFETWRYLDWLSRGIVLVLLVMLVQTFFITAVAAAKHASARRQSRRFAMEAKAALRDGRLKDAIAIALKYKKSHAADVAAAGLCAYRDLPRSLTEGEARDCVERAMKRASAVKAAEMRVGLMKLKTIAETAPLIGAFGTMVGLLNSFRGGSGDRWSWLSHFAGSFYLALMFVALGLFVAILAMWAHGWLDKRSRAIAREMRDSALNTMERLRAFREWRDSGTDAGSADARHEAGASLEVAWEWPGIVLIAVVGFEFFFYCIVMLGVWGLAITGGGYEWALGICLFSAGVVALPIRLARRGGAVCAAGQEASVGPRFYHWSIERRRKARLPLRERLATLPDRTAVFGVPMLAMLMVMAYLNSIPEAVGIPVEIASPAPVYGRESFQQPLVLQVERTANAKSYAEPALFRLQRRLVDEADLLERLKRELALREDRSVVIYGDRDLPFQTMAKALDIVNNVGGKLVLAGNTKVK